MKEFLERVLEKAKNMTPEEVVELQEEARRTMSDPEFIEIGKSSLLVFSKEEV